MEWIFEAKSLIQLLEITLIFPETLKKARGFVAHRFPNLENAPLLEIKVCPYENSPDGNFFFDRLPETTNTFILGGGSGHGFKHGPAFGYLVAQVLAGEKKSPVLFSLQSKNTN